jgi:hypothetical protein
MSTQEYTEQERTELQGLLNRYEALPGTFGGAGFANSNAIDEIKGLLDRREGRKSL